MHRDCFLLSHILRALFSVHFFVIPQIIALTTLMHTNALTHNVELFVNYEVSRVSAFMLRGLIKFIEFNSNGRPNKNNQQDFMCTREKSAYALCLYVGGERVKSHLAFSFPSRLRFDALYFIDAVNYSVKKIFAHFVWFCVCVFPHACKGDGSRYVHAFFLTRNFCSMPNSLENFLLLLLLLFCCLFICVLCLHVHWKCNDANKRIKHFSVQNPCARKSD